jgi:hypothetical protein
MVPVENALNIADGAVELAVVESPLTPFSGEIPELVFRVVQPVAVSVRKMPDVIAAVEIVVHVVNERGDGIRLPGSAGTPPLRLGDGAEDEQRCYRDQDAS